MGAAMTASNKDDWTSTLACSACGDSIGYGEECYLIRVVRTRVMGQGSDCTLELEDVLTPDGDYAFNPHFLEVQCWSSEVEQVHACNEDAEVGSTSVPDYCVCSCSICKSQVAIGEIVAVAHLGRILLSQQSPNGEESDFVAMGTTPDVLCASCLWVLNDQVTVYWDENDAIAAINEAADTRSTWVTG